MFRWGGVVAMAVVVVNGVSIAHATWAKIGWILLGMLVAASVSQATARKS